MEYNFGGLDLSQLSAGEEAFAVLPVPYDLTSSYQAGSRRGPSAILDASGYVELYDDELRRETWRVGIATRDYVEVDVRGPRHMIERVRHEVASILSEGKIPVVLGGEHSITLGAVQAARESYPSLTVLQLDAHADLRESYQESLYSHACVARRITEIPCPLVQVGIRSLTGDEARFIDENSETILSLSADDTLVDGWIDRVCERLSDDVYVSIDLDAFDPSIMPATGTPEPGGLTWRDATRLLRAVSNQCRVRGFDVVELCPIPGQPASDFMAAKLVYRFMGYIAEVHK